MPASEVGTGLSTTDSSSDARVNYCKPEYSKEARMACSDKVQESMDNEVDKEARCPHMTLSFSMPQTQMLKGEAEYINGNS